ncbi:hypothetical protein [Neobacillus sp. NPDC093127]|uniref:hypothetical protein n=1 Tax=Neobacillus sp. NPDC093127 TaxID=3364296 RepID=UPI003816AE3D
MKKYLSLFLVFSLAGCQGNKEVKEILATPQQVTSTNKTTEQIVLEKTQPLADYSKLILPYQERLKSNLEQFNLIVNLGSSSPTFKADLDANCKELLQIVSEIKALDVGKDEGVRSVFSMFSLAMNEYQYVAYFYPQAISNSNSLEIQNSISAMKKAGDYIKQSEAKFLQLTAEALTHK